MRRALGKLLACLLAGVLPAAAWAQSPWPMEAPGRWGLAIVDVETTGLDAAHHEMIDLGVIYTDLDGNELGRHFVRIHPPHPERADPQAVAVNGYAPARWQALGAVDEAEAVAGFLAFHARLAGERRFLFTAYNAPFDKAFLDALLKRHGAAFDGLYTYFVLDIPSLAWGAGIRHLANAQVAQALGVAEETRDPLAHTGASGVEWNARLLQALRERDRLPWSSPPAE